MKKFLINFLFCLMFFTHTESSEVEYSNEQWNLYDIFETCEGRSSCIDEAEALLKSFPSKVTNRDNWMYHEVRYWLADFYYDSEKKENKKKGFEMWREIFNDPQYEDDDQYKLYSAVALGWNYYVDMDFRDYKKAFQFMKYAADQDLHWALNNMGVFYDQGRAVKQNYKKAFEYYNKAADLGSNWAHGNIAILYTFGLGVKKDYDKAIIHLKLARFEWGYESDEFSELMVLFNKKRLPKDANEYMSWLENLIIENQSVDDFQNLAWISDIDKSVINPRVTEYKWHLLTTKLSETQDFVDRSFQEMDFLQEELLRKEEVILAEKQAEEWIEKNWKN